MDYQLPPIDQAELVRIRRQLHMYPELRWDLPRTAALVKEELSKAGIPFVADQYGPNTIVATINGEKDAFTIGIRADMDALPIQERNEDRPYRSRHDGIMHACGHDAHTAMLIGTAKALYAIRDSLNCRVKLLFQPCEESRPSGARTMCEHDKLFVRRLQGGAWRQIGSCRLAACRYRCAGSWCEDLQRHSAADFS